MHRRFAFATAFAAALAAPSVPACAWESTGHRMINAAAVTALPDSVPAFVRSADARAEIAELGPEPDLLKSSGRTYVADLSPGHYLDVDDAAKIGPVALAALPPTREAFDTALRSAGLDQYRTGYLPYEIMDGWEAVATDFAYWRVDVAGARSAAAAADRQWFDGDRRLRETLTLRDIGVWGHYVADGSQPLHVTVHYNGWGTYPNPQGYSNSHTLHARFEGPFVDAHATAPALAARIRPFAACGCTIAANVERFLAASHGEVPAVYALEAQDAFTRGTPQAVDFVDTALANGASELRDLIAEAWLASEARKVGYPPTAVSDVEAGRVLPSKSLFGE